MKKQLYTLLTGLTLVIGTLSIALPAFATTTVEVYKSPTCGCCSKWVDHMRDHGFTVITKDVGNKEIRQKVGMSETLGSCHTALVNGYVMEGHIPAPDIIRFLKERPDALGLAVPDMPHGSPGMEGQRVDPYNVLKVNAPGDTRRDTEIYQRYDPYAKKTASPAPASPAPSADTEGFSSIMRLKN
ncbi:DUF411 domain-containing protein [Nitrosomonas sp.]|uniref:DUF411 domain-containing protein n=1 Tax=Nitrosomonas sp. TaxID=42353 RepID=UPI001D32ACF5|nr:DUF411 domain-containing protein [Nitrosomonas sp.]MCB1948643.1 DUF411 domain-containing protein [Nitrosomonas sp.]MCP5243222.1 DUF411 domain-containing protein [Burkholderiales bacterium]MDR4513999.1 DUF411 domain-containing protein [Nitrosomonas sp.]